MDERATSRLQPWRAAPDAARAHRVRVWMASAVLATLALGFLVLVVWPLRVPRVQFVILEYEAVEAAGVSPTSGAELTQFADRQLDEVSQFVRVHQSAWYATHALTRGMESFSDGTAWASASGVVPDVMLFYAAGIPQWRQDRLLIFRDVADMVNPRLGIDLTAITEELAASGTPAMLLVDWEQRADTPSGLLPEWTMWRLEQQLSQYRQRYPDASTRVIVRACESRDDTARDANPGGSQRGLESSLAAWLPEAFEAGNDLNHDALISVSEFCAAARTMTNGQGMVLPANSDEVLGPNLESVASVPLLRIGTGSRGSKAGSDEETSQQQAATTTAAVAGKTSPISGPKQQPSASDLESTHHFSAIAPTATMAAFLWDAGIQTERGEEASLLVSQLDQLARKSEGEAAAAEWLQAAAEREITWPVDAIAREILGAGMPWETRRQLLRSHLIYERLRLETISPKQTDDGGFAPDELVAAGWELLETQRYFTRGVRADHRAYVTDHVARIYRTLIGLEAEAARYEKAKSLAKQALLRADEVFAAPIIGAQADADLTVRLLKAIQRGLESRGGGWLKWGDPKQFAARGLTATALWERWEASFKAGETQPRNVRASGTRREVSEETSLNRNVVAVTETRLSRLLLLQRLDELLQERTTTPEWVRATQDSLLVFGGSDWSEQAANKALDHLQKQWSGWQLSQVAYRSTSQDTLSPEDAGRMANRVAREAQRALWDAGASERTRLQQVVSRAQRIIDDTDSTGLAGDVTADGSFAGEWPSAQFIEDPTRRNLGRLVMTLPSRTAARLPADVKAEVEYDDRSLVFEPVNPGAEGVRLVAPSETRYLRHESAEPTKSRIPAKLASLRSSADGTGQDREDSLASTGKATQAEFLVRRIADMPCPEAIQVRWMGADISRRVSVALPAVRPGMVELEEPALTTIPNVTEKRLPRFRAIGLEKRRVSIRVLALSRKLAIPVVPLPKSDAIRQQREWGPVETLSLLPELEIIASDFRAARFPPQKLKPSDPERTAKLIVYEVCDLDREEVQWIACEPEVVRPFGLLEPQVSYDHQRDQLRVTFNRVALPRESQNRQPLRLRVELFSLDSGRTTATASQVVSALTESPIQLSTITLRGERVGLRIEVNEWPNAFLYAFALTHTQAEIAESDDLLGVTFEGSLTFAATGEAIKVAGGTPSAPTRVSTVLSDRWFAYGEDRVRVGVDLNEDRILEAEPYVEVRAPVAMRCVWCGVSPEGELCWQGRVGPQELNVPTEMLEQGRYRLLAELFHGERTVWNQGPDLVLDSGKPTVSGVRVESPIPLVLGRPVALELEVTDEGLSGVTRVEMAWAEQGRLEFLSGMKPVPAELLVDGRWKAALPTSEKLEGTHILLVRCTDAVGNMSDVKTVPLELLTEATIRARREQETTVVRGAVQYVTRPVGGLTVRLLPKSGGAQSPGASENTKSEESEKSEATQSDGLADSAQQGSRETQTDAQGQFALSDVRRGTYELVVTGRYQGMDYQASRVIEVQPPTPTAVPAIRID